MISEGVMKTLREEYPRTSWAIWSEDFPRRGCIEEDSERFVGYVQSQRHRLRPDLVFLGLNPSTDAPSDFANFHSPSLRHADRDLRIVVEESGLEGGFMTDCSDTVEPRGERLDLESEFLQTFFAQLKTLPGAEYTVVCFGRRVFDEIRSAVKSSAEELAEGCVLAHVYARGARSGILLCLPLQPTFEPEAPRKPSGPAHLSQRGIRRVNPSQGIVPIGGVGHVVTAVSTSPKRTRTNRRLS